MFHYSRKTISITVTFLTFYFTTVSNSGAEIVDRIAAIVGDDIILLSDVVKVAEVVKSRARATLGQEIPDEEAMKMALKELIDNKLIEREARQLRVSVSSEELDTAFEDQIASQGITKEQFLNYLKMQGMNEEIYRNLILRSQLLKYKVIGLKVGGPKVTEEDVKKYYNQQIMSIMMKSTYKIAHIFLKVPENADAVTVAQIYEKAKTLAKRAREGEEFAELAMQYSQDGKTARSGGVLGKFKHGQLPPEIDKVLPFLEEEEVSDPVRTPQGFHIIKMLKKKSPRVRPFEEVKSQIMEDLLNEELERQIQILLKELRKSTYIEIK